jgi:hypothetical protein
MTLADVANLSQVVAGFVVLVGLVFAMVQVSEMSRQRREASALQLGAAFANPDFAKAFREVLDLPPGAKNDDVAQRGAQDAAMLVSLTIESVAIMVHRRVIDLDMVWELMGGVVLSSWDRTRAWAEGYRRASGSEKFNEWFQWLAERMEERYRGEAAEPAFRRHPSWRP